MSRPRLHYSLLRGFAATLTGDFAGLVKTRIHATVDQLAHNLTDDHIDYLVHGPIPLLLNR